MFYLILISSYLIANFSLKLNFLSILLHIITKSKAANTSHITCCFIKSVETIINTFVIIINNL